MKNQNIIVLGLAGLAVYMIWQARKKGTTVTQQANDMVSEILGSNGQAFTNGWRYFSDGTSIDPSGNYYKDGQMIWSPSTAKTGAGASGSW